MATRSLLLAAALSLSCTTAVASPADEEDAWARAVTACGAGDEAGAISALEVALTEDPQAVQRALLEPAFDAGLRDRPAFRSLVDEAAVAHRISRLTLVGPEETGEWIEVEGRTLGPDGKPVAGAVVRLFATDAEGRYHPVLQGERTPRIFGTVVSDREGHFAFRTVRPGPYPGTRSPRHVHVGVRAEGLRLAVPGYVVFDDDPLLDEPQNAEPRAEAVRIRMRVDAEGVARGTLELPLR